MEQDRASGFPIDRRDFVKGGLAASGLVGAASLLGGTAAAATGSGGAVVQSIDGGSPGAPGFISLAYSNGIEGDSTLGGREGTSDVLGVDWLTIGEAATGRPPEGAGVVKIEKRPDTATPALYQALDGGTTLDEVVLKFYRISDSGALEQFYTLTFSTVSVASIELLTTNPTLQFTEVVGFVPEAVTVDHAAGYQYGFSL